MASCLDHGVALPCPLCAQECWPVRDLQAVADFAGKCMGELPPPEMKTIRLSEVVRSIGRRWAEIERVKHTVFKPLYATKNGLVREARIGAIDVGRLEKAAFECARGQVGHPDPITNAYIQAILQDEVPW